MRKEIFMRYRETHHHATCRECGRILPLDNFAYRGYGTMTQEFVVHASGLLGMATELVTKITPLMLSRQSYDSFSSLMRIIG